MSPSAIAAAWASGLFAAGALVIGLYGLRDRGTAADLWRVYASTAAIAAAILLPLALHPLLFAAVVAACAYRGTIELATTYALRVTPSRHAALALVAVLATAWGATREPEATRLLFGATVLAIACTAPLYARAFRRPPRGAPGWTAALAFPLLAAAHLAHLASGPEGFARVFVIYAACESQDSAAYLFGRLFGRRRLLPRLSPKKTVAGALAGALAGVAIGAATAWAMLDLSPARASAFGAIAVAAGFCGDLYTSALKRGAGVKDFPPVHARHGGVLDIYDSTLFAALIISIGLYIIPTWMS